MKKMCWYICSGGLEQVHQVYAGNKTPLTQYMVPKSVGTLEGVGCTNTSQDEFVMQRDSVNNLVFKPSSP